MDNDLDFTTSKAAARQHYQGLAAQAARELEFISRAQDAYEVRGELEVLTHDAVKLVKNGAWIGAQIFIPNSKFREQRK